MSDHRPSMLTVEMRIVCKRCHFNVNTGSPSYTLVLNPYSENPRSWREHGSDAGCDLLYRFLDGQEIVREQNYVEFIVPDFHVPDFLFWMTDENVPNFLFIRNSRISYLNTVCGRKIQMEIARETIRVERTFRGNSKEYGGPYRKFKIAFSTRVKLLEPVADISERDLEKHYWLDLKSPEKEEETRLRELKAFVRNRDGIYLGSGNMFIAPAPKCIEDYEAIFKSEMKCWGSLGFVNLLALARDLAENGDDRKAIDEFSKSHALHDSESNPRIVRKFGAKGYDGYTSIHILLPCTKQPWLFSLDVRNGVAACEKFVSSWIANDQLSDAVFKSGKFQLTITASWDSRNSKEQRLYKPVEFMNRVIAFLKAMLNFVDSTMCNENDVPIRNTNAARERLSERILEAVRLSPTDFLESEVTLIKELANRYVMG